MTTAGNRAGLAMASERKPTASTDEAAVARDGVAPLPNRMHKARVVHAAITYQDERNHARTVHGIGFRVECSCGETFRVRASWAMAQAEKREHVRLSSAEKVS